MSEYEGHEVGHDLGDTLREFATFFDDLAEALHDTHDPVASAYCEELLVEIDDVLHSVVDCYVALSVVRNAAEAREALDSLREAPDGQSRVKGAGSAIRPVQ